jgi:hypothetical protein
MKGLFHLYFSYLYKRKASKIINLLFFYFVVLYMVFYSIYYTNIIQIWFNSELKDYSDIIFFYIINYIFHVYELLFKVISKYATYFPSISQYRLDGGVIVVDNLRAMQGSSFRTENNTFAQRAFPKPHFTLLAYIFFIFYYAYYSCSKLFVRKKNMYFFLSLCHLQIIFYIFNLYMIFVFFSEYQLNV